MGNNKIWISLLALVFLLSGCGGEAAGGAPQKSAPEAGPVSFVAGMGCTDPNCTDPGHHHDCPVDCADYEHHHNCTLDCAEPSHNHKDHHEEPHHTAAVEPAPSVEPQPEPAPEPEPVPAPQPEPPAVQTQTLTAVSYISGMGCSDPNCTDPSHYHSCPADCANYEHHHSCALDCAEPSHCHAGTAVSTGGGRHHGGGHHGRHH